MNGYRFPWRGFLLDSARKFQTRDWILGLIDQLAEYKLNVLHWHLTDDEGWRMWIPKYPNLVKPFQKGVVWMDEGFYTHEDIREIVEYAHRRHVTIVPEIEMPGHCHCVVVNYPQLSPVEDPGRRASNQPKYTYRCREINIGDPDSLSFYQDVLKAVMELFPSKVIHVGGDEADVSNWSTNAECLAKMRQLGISDPALLQKWWMNEMSQWVRQQGRTSMAWAERLDLANPPQGQIVHGWHSESEAAIHRGWQTVNSSASYTYFDYGNALGDRYGLLPLPGVYAFDPVPAGASPEQARLVLGSTAALWSTEVPQAELYPRIFPRLLAFSEVVWTPQAQRSFSEFIPRARAHLKRLDAAGMAYWNAVELLPPAHIAHAALGCPVTYRVPPDSRYPDRGASSLTDGKLATTDYLAPGWVGWEGSDMDAVLSLGHDTKIETLASRFLESVQAGIYLPNEVEFAVSVNGKDFISVGTVPRRDAIHSVSAVQQFGNRSRVSTHRLST